MAFQEYQQTFYISYREKINKYYTYPVFSEVFDFCVRWPERFGEHCCAEILTGDERNFWKHRVGNRLRCYRTKKIRLLMVIPEAESNSVNIFMTIFKRKFPEWSIKMGY